MDTDNIASLKEELKQFQTEKEKIRNIVGGVGGAAKTKHANTINVLFIAAIAGLFLLDIVHHVLDINTYLPPLLAVQLGVLLVSVKIIWMIHRQTKIEHFQFWILNSIEFRLNDIAKTMKEISRRLDSR